MNNYVIGDSLISLIKPTVIKKKKKKHLLFRENKSFGKISKWLPLKMYGSLQSDSL